jgi:hypothetical protein
MTQNWLQGTFHFFLITRKKSQYSNFKKIIELWESPLKILNLQISENQTGHLFCNFLKT